MSILQYMYDHEINAQIAWFWDGGFDISLGDGLNGFSDQTTVDTWNEAEMWFLEKIAERFPVLKTELDKLGGTSCSEP